MRFADLDAVTIDAFGTLVELIDPVPALQTALAKRGLDPAAEAVREAVRAESAYYRGHLAQARDDGSLHDLRVRCTRVFLDALGVELSSEEFMPVFVESLQFRLLDHVEQALALLRSRGLELAVVANWDLSLAGELDRLGLSRFFSVVEPSAEKPDPQALLGTLRRLGVPPQRALHIGDEQSDEQAAVGAGAHFLPAPLHMAVAQLR